MERQATQDTPLEGPIKEWHLYFQKYHWTDELLHVTLSGFSLLQNNAYFKPKNNLGCKSWNAVCHRVKTKIKIFKNNILSVLLYGSECWKMMKEICKKLDTFQMKCLGRIRRIFWPEKIRNEDLLKRCNIWNQFLRVSREEGSCAYNRAVMLCFLPNWPKSCTSCSSHCVDIKFTF